MYHSCFSAICQNIVPHVPLCAIPLGAEHRCQASKMKLTAMACYGHGKMGFPFGNDLETVDFLLNDELRLITKWVYLLHFSHVS